MDQSSDSIAALSMLAFTAGEATGPLAGGGLVELIGFQRACIISHLRVPLHDGVYLHGTTFYR